MVPAPSGNRGAPTKKRKLQTNDNVKSAEFDSPFLADSLNFKPEFLTNMIDLDLGTSAVSFRICYWNNMESQFLSPVGVPPHLRSEGIYRVHTSVYCLCDARNIWAMKTHPYSQTVLYIPALGFMGEQVIGFFLSCASLYYIDKYMLT